MSNTDHPTIVESGAPSARRFASDESGVAAIEFGLLALPFFLVFLALLEIAAVFAGEVVLERAVEKVGRQVRTGEIRSGQMERADFERRLCAEVSFMMDCSRLRVDTAAYSGFGDIDHRPPTGPDGRPDYSDFGFETGGPDTVVALRAFYAWPIHLDFLRGSLGDLDGNFPMTAMAAFRTEGF